MITIIVCTYNRAQLLTECLDSLVNQSLCNTKYKVLIIDNNSTDETFVTCHKYVRLYENIKYIFEKKQGLSHARNRGVVESDTEWIGYLDDDAKAKSGWLERAIYIISNYNFDAFGGYYYPWYRDGRPDWYLDSYASNLGLNITEAQELPENKFFSGGNCFYKRRILIRKHEFSDAHGMIGDKLGYGEETLLQINLKKQGYIIGFDPELIIEHYVALYKQNLTWFLRNAYAQGRCHFTSHGIDPSYRVLIHRQLNVFINSILRLKSSIKMYHNEGYRKENIFIDIVSPIFRSFGEIYTGIKLVIDQRTKSKK